MLNELLEERKLPKLKSGDEMLQILLDEEYGHMPPKPDFTEYAVTDNFIPAFCAGKAISKKVDITVAFGDDKFTFPIYVSIPSSHGKHPFFVCINFRDCVPDRYIPVEEIVDNGFGVLSFCYKDVTDDNADFDDGIAHIFSKGGRNASSPGKIAMWAWAAQRVMDYAQTLDCLDADESIVCGHSRLGKTALLAAAVDRRFRFAYSNNSGCSGAALSRGKNGETIADITHNFPYWFCDNYKKYADNEFSLPFDQHFLIAAIAPRYAYIASAAEDLWADPNSEFLSCAAASAAYRKFGKSGFVYGDRLPCCGDEYHDGRIGYHLRSGMHYFSREDWQKIMKFAKKHLHET